MIPSGRKFLQQSEFDHICVFQYASTCAIDVWSRSSFKVTTCTLPKFLNVDVSRQNSRSCTDNSFFIDCKCNQTNFGCTLWLYSLDMNLFHWFYSYHLWLKVVFKISQEFPTASLGVTQSNNRNAELSLLSYLQWIHTHTHTHRVLYILCAYLIFGKLSINYSRVPSERSGIVNKLNETAGERRENRAHLARSLMPWFPSFPRDRLKTSEKIGCRNWRLTDDIRIAVLRHVFAIDVLGLLFPFLILLQGSFDFVLLFSPLYGKRATACILLGVERERERDRERFICCERERERFSCCTSQIHAGTSLVHHY